VRRFVISPSALDFALIEQAANVLKEGGLVAFPTETVYGLGANALSKEAIQKIFRAKGRPANNPLIVHVASPEMAKQVVSEWPELAHRLAEAFWPGPLTLVLPKRQELPLEISAGLPSVGVRMPAHPVALALIRHARVPVAAPSANPYMGVSPTTAAHVAAGLASHIDVLIDGGPCAVGLESTVLDLTREVPTVLRPGGLPLETLRNFLGALAILDPQALSQGTLPSPGLARRHYAPKAPVSLFDSLEALLEEAGRLLAFGRRVGALGLGATPMVPPGLVYTAMPLNPGAYGAELYAALHNSDASAFDHLLIQSPPPGEAWLAVRDRLKRSASEA
jgi:L-threonylcarbamoyladenylate synthase